MRARYAAFLAGSAVALVACRSATEIRVEVSTDLPCDQIAAAGIAVGEIGAALESAPVSTSASTCSDGKIGTVVLVPSGDESGDVAFKVYAAVAGATIESCVTNGAQKSCIVARRALRFLPHESMAVAVPMKAACEGTPCENDETCVDGACTKAQIVDPTECVREVCGEDALAAPPASDAGSDATIAEGGGGDAGADGATSDGAASDGGEDAPPPGDGGFVDAPIGSCGPGCALSLGQKFTCAAREGGVSCWGQNVQGELGRGNEVGSGLAPGAVLSGPASPLSGVVDLVSGQDDTCALLAGGSWACWGSGSVLGPQSNTIDYATTLSELAGASQVAIGSYHACWLLPNDAGIECANAAVASGNSGSPAHHGDGGVGPAPNDLPRPIAQLAASTVITCVRSPAGTVTCEGDNGSFEVDPSQGAVELGPTASTLPAQPVAELALMDQTTCARALDGRVWCWGNDGQGAAGGNEAANGFGDVTYADGGALVAAQLAAGASFGCALLASSQVACWGANDWGQLGRGIIGGANAGDPRAALVRDADGGVFSGATLLRAGSGHACAMKSDGSLWCWGWNAEGQLGDVDAGDRPSPTRVSW